MKKDIENKVQDCTACLASGPTRPKIPINVGRDAEGVITNHMVMAKTKAEEKQHTENQKSPMKKNSTERNARKELAINTSGEINPKKTDTV